MDRTKANNTNTNNHLPNTENPAGNKKTDGSLSVFLGALFFSGSGTIQSFAPEEATAFILGALRLLSAGIFLIVWCRAKNLLHPLKNVNTCKVILSALALAGFQISFFLGVRSAGVAVGTVVTIGTTPLMAAVFGLLFFREIPGKSWYISTTIAIAGLILLNVNDMDTFNIKGLLFPVTAGTIYAFYLSQSKELLRANRPEIVMTFLFMLSSLFLLPIWFLFPCAWVFTAKGLVIAFGLGIITTAVPYCLVMAGLKNCGTAKAATLSLGEPLGAAILGFTVLHEPINLLSFIGIIAIFTSVLVLIYCTKK